MTRSDDECAGLINVNHGAARSMLITAPARSMLITAPARAKSALHGFYLRLGSPWNLISDTQIIVEVVVPVTPDQEGGFTDLLGPNPHFRHARGMLVGGQWFTPKCLQS